MRDLALKYLPAWLADALLAQRGLYGRAAVAALFTNIFALTSSLFSMVVYNRVVPSGATASLAALSIGLAVVLAFDFILRILRGWFVDVAGREVDAALGNQMFARLLQMRLADRQNSAGAFAGLLRELETLRDTLASTTLIALVDLPFTLLFLGVIAVLGGPLVLVPLLMIPVVVLSSLAVQPTLDRLARETLGQGFTKQGVVVETVAGLETVQAGRAGPMLEGRWARAMEDNAGSALSSRLLSAVAVNVASSAQTIAYVGTLIHGVILITAGELSSGALIAASLLAGRVVAPLGQVAGILTRLSASRAAIARLDQFMAAPPAPGTAASVRRTRLEGGVELRNVSLRYPGTGRAVLSGINLRIAPGERVAIIGRVGSGKSSIARMVLGLYQPTEGQVLIDGADLRQLHPDDLHANIGAVLQDVTLFSGSIRDNILLTDPALDDAELLRVAKLSGTHAVVGGLENGFDRTLADRGEGLSGGQKQGIAIARALAGRPPILVLDEPTSAMDNQAEAQLVARLQEELAGRTVLIVTHRQPVLRLVSRVIVIADGRIVADGPRDAVLASLAGAPA
ncbi:MAG: type I secretion system permease/ATPase [Sphingomonadales bacterium]|jgi:ATP-binding cassette subfamily C protein LapB